jgi:two-component system sensor histidine kinase ChiS
VRDEVELAGDRFDWRTLGAVRLKGRANPVELFELLDADPEPERVRKLEYAAEFDDAIGAFASGALRQALLRFEHTLSLNPEDAVARAYAAHVVRLLESGDDGFDGTYVLTDK